MHKVTNNRMTWGWCAFLYGALMLALVILCRFSLCQKAPSAAATRSQPATVPTDTFEVEQRRLEPDRSLIGLFNHHTGKTVWTRTLCEVQVVRWSDDRQALAVIGTLNQDACSFVLLAWRNGTGVRAIRDIRPLDLWDAAHEAIWSPDNRRLLLVGQRGMGVPCLDLWCFRLRDSQTRFVADDVTQEEWSSPTRVRYRRDRLSRNSDRPGGPVPSRALQRRAAHGRVELLVLHGAVESLSPHLGMEYGSRGGLGHAPGRLVRAHVRRSCWPATSRPPVSCPGRRSSPA
jgi:hypothetical protein